ncbi:MAG: hypothetical protein E7458_07070 [Ruminococcaceae bacterium]|nr:hypothetical protein [Oscillospiraceae bacterium]
MEWIKHLDGKALAATAVGKLTALYEKRGAAVDGARRAALTVWARLAAMVAAVCACFRRPGLSEIAAVAAFALAAVGGIVSIFKKSWRKLAPLFAILAALGTVIIVLRCLFPRRED